MTAVVVKEDETHATRESVFVLTVMWLDGEFKPPSEPNKRRCRTWGWFPTLDLAEEAVRGNHADMYEDGYYNVAVLEEFPWGALAIARAEHWYAAVPHWATRSTSIDHYDVRKIDKPTALEQVVGFGMG